MPCVSAQNRSIAAAKSARYKPRLGNEAFVSGDPSGAASLPEQLSIERHCCVSRGPPRKLVLDDRASGEAVVREPRDVRERAADRARQRGWIAWRHEPSVLPGPH